MDFVKKHEIDQMSINISDEQACGRHSVVWGCCQKNTDTDKNGTACSIDGFNPIRP